MTDQEGKNLGGRPRIIESPEKMDELVREYRDKCEAKGEVLTLTGMIMHLGLSSRQSLDQYQDYDGFYDSVKAAKLMIENEYEKSLRVNGRAGDIFGLKNFGWSDKQEHEHSGPGGGAIKTEGKNIFVPVGPDHGKN